MKGIVDSVGRALLKAKIRSRTGSKVAEAKVWIDTGFTGDLVIPQASIDEMGLQQSGSVDAVLADGSQTELRTYSCIIDWFGGDRKLEVIANNGEYPLLGVGLLQGLELRVDYHNSKLTLEPVVEETT